MLKYKETKRFKREWGTEIYFHVLSDKDEFLQCTYLTFRGDLPSEEKIVERLTARVTRIEQKMSEPETVPEMNYTENEVVDLLVEKGYLQEGQKLSDLPVKEIKVG